MISRGSDGPLILFYTRFFRERIDPSAMCEGLPGRWTVDRSRLPEADAVVFHLPNLPEFGDARKYPGQIWVLWTRESRQNYPRLHDPALLRHFDVRLTYETSAEVWDPYLPTRTWWDEVRTRRIEPRAADAPVVMFQTSGYNLSGREEFARELAGHVEIASFGRFMNNRAADGADRGPQTKLDTIARYPFCVAFENSICADYVTEKMYDPLWAGTIPVYLGAPNAEAFAPPHSFIDASKFAGPKELAAYLHHLLRTPDEYAAYFRWRDQPYPPAFEKMIDRVSAEPMAALAAEVASRMANRPADVPGRAAMVFGWRSFLRSRIRRIRKNI